MILRPASFLILALMLASCAEDRGNIYADQLVDRFDVPDCADARILSAGRNPDQTKPGAKRVYAVDGLCIGAMLSALDVIGFQKTGNATYQYTSNQDWFEIVQLTPADSQQHFGIVWETIDP